MIIYDESAKSFYLEGKNFTYALRVTPDGYLTKDYFGKKIARADLGYYKPEWVKSFNPVIPGSKALFADIMQEYATAFLGDYREPALIPCDGRGVKIADLKYDSFRLSPEKKPVSSGIPTARGGETLEITLRDFDSGLKVILYYTVYPDLGIITRRAETVNGTDGEIKLERALSFTLDFYDSNFELLTLWGHHAAEKIPERTPLHHGRSTVGNVRGTTSANHAAFAALVRPETTEEHGEVYASALLYSGSHYESAEVDEAGRTRLCAGINPESFGWTLSPGESFETPEAAICYTDEGIGGMSRAFHDFFREYVIDPKWAKRRRPVVLNSWEGMHFSFDRDRLFDTIDALRGSGIELFVLDDGWFGARSNDKAGLGDWYVNEEKLPGGLRAISDRCRENGLEFGLWIEPEMVNPDSDLYRAHPDWAITVPGRTPVASRNQLVLDYSRPDVLSWIKETMYRVISEAGVSYIKWDMNRPLTENFSRFLPAGRQGEVQHRFVLGMYELARFLTESFPNILFEGCSGGGGRFDGAMLAFFPQIWTSDNTDADDRMQIQYGTGLVFPLSASSNHVSLSPNIRNGRIIGAQTRTDVAFLGTFGYEFDVRKYPADEYARIAADVEKYKKIAPLVLEGDVYRKGMRPRDNACVISVVSKDKSSAYVTFYHALNPHKTKPRFTVPGLDPDRLYRIEELDLTLPGSVLSQLGLVIPRFRGDFCTASFLLTAV